MSSLINHDLNVINIGLSGFGDVIRQSGARAVDLHWHPPAGGEPEAAWKLACLMADPCVMQANATAFQRYLAAQPVLIGVKPARDAIPGMSGKIILHSGPPISWDKMCGPQQGAVLGAVLFEGWAADLAAAHRLLASGAISLHACHHHQAVGPMAGIISPSMPVWIVHDSTNGGRAYANMNEGLGKVLRFGANNPDVLNRLRWMADVMGPTLAAVVEEMGGLELKPLMAQALHMGDEVHNRNVAASSLLFRKLTVTALSSSHLPREAVAEVLSFIAGNDHFFLNLSMAACKAMLDAAHGVPFSTLVTAMARNGVDFGVRISGMDQWFTAQAPYIEGLFFPGYGPDDAARDLGDSAITETAGVGGFSMAASPAIVQFVGGTPKDALAHTRRMLNITLGQNAAFSLPALDFTGAPAGIDACLVADTGILPIINTGIAHRKAGVGQVGAGITHAPLSCFIQAVTALADSMNVGQNDRNGGR